MLLFLFLCEVSYSLFFTLLIKENFKKLKHLSEYIIFVTLQATRVSRVFRHDQARAGSKNLFSSLVREPHVNLIQKIDLSMSRERLLLFNHRGTIIEMYRNETFLILCDLAIRHHRKTGSIKPWIEALGKIHLNQVTLSWDKGWFITK